MAELSEEQRKALMEKLKNMSPEELKDFQKKQCIFCQIVGGKMEAKMVFEDDNVIAVLDINPANMGHILVMPKEHYAIMPQIPDDEMVLMSTLSRKNEISKKLSGQLTPEMQQLQDDKMQLEVESLRKTVETLEAKAKADESKTLKDISEVATLISQNPKVALIMDALQASIAKEVSSEEVNEGNNESLPPPPTLPARPTLGA